MAYKVQYTPQDNYRYPTVNQYVKKRRSGIGIVLLLCLLVLLIAYNGLPDYLIPGDPYITRTAAVEMVSNMKNGASVKDAVFAFCKQILEGAGVY